MMTTRRNLKDWASRMITPQRTLKDWASIIANRLSDAQLNELTSLLDNDAGNDFYHWLNEINASRNPQEYREAEDSTKTQALAPPDHEM